MAKKKLLIIAGHGKNYDGSYDPGACSKWGQEATYTRELATLIQKSIGSALTVTMYPQSQNCYSYSKNGKVPAYKGYDYVLEIHFNAKAKKDPDGNGSFTGIGGYYHPNNAGKSIADSMVNAVAALGFKKWQNCTSTGLHNLNKAQAAGVKYFLLETAFIDDGDDMTWYTANKAAVAKAIAQTLINGLGGTASASTPTTTTAKKTVYKIQCGAFKKKKLASKRAEKLKKAGFSCYMSKSGSYYRIWCGTFEQKSNAEALVKELKEKGFSSVIKTKKV